MTEQGLAVKEARTKRYLADLPPGSTHEAGWCREVLDLCTALRKAWETIAALEACVDEADTELDRLRVRVAVLEGAPPPDPPSNLVAQFYRRGGGQ